MPGGMMCSCDRWPRKRAENTPSAFGGDSRRRHAAALVDELAGRDAKNPRSRHAKSDMGPAVGDVAIGDAI